MRILAFHADGFGLLQDQGLDGLCPQLCLFEGPNESGKSTLVELLRYILFGTPGPRARVRAPLRGGRPGGRLRLRTEGGEEFLVERGEDGLAVSRLAGAGVEGGDGDGDGEKSAAEPSERWFGGLDRTTFDRVFAIGLEELQGLDVVEEEALRGRLLAAGSGLGGVDLPAVLGRLDRELRSLLLLRGQRPRINRLLSRQRKIDGDIAELQQLPARYHELSGRRRALVAAIASGQERLRTAEHRRRRLEVLARLREPWRRWRQTCAEVDRLEGEAGAGELDLDALEHALSRLREAEERHAEAAQRMELLAQRRRDLGGDDGAGAMGRIRRRREILTTLRGLLQRREVLDAEHRRLLDSMAHLDRRRTEIRLLQAQATAAAPLWALPLALLLPFLLPILEPSRGAWLAAAGTVLGWVIIIVVWRRRQRRLAQDRHLELEAELAELDRRSLEVSQEFLEVDDALRGIPNDLRHHAAAVGWPAPADDQELSELARALDETAARLEAQRQLDSNQEQEATVLEQATMRLEQARRILETILDAAGAENTEEYRRRAQARRAAVEKRREQEGLRRNLDALLGADDDQAAFEGELRRLDPEELAREGRRLGEEVPRLEREIDARRRDLGALEAELEWLGREERLGSLLLERQILAVKTTDDVRSWAVAALARSILEDARDSYEHQRLPRVVRRAAALLDTMTAGACRLVAVDGGEGLVIESGRLDHRSERAWSSGLADQVYLALRLALAEEMGRHHEPLPLILDDILVRLDPQRQENTARALAQVAAGRQMLFFTCHPQSRQILQKAAAESGVSSGLYLLDDGRLSAAP